MAKTRFRGSVLPVKRPLRRAVLGLMLGAAAGGGALAVMASAQTIAPQLPDLRSDPPDGQSPPEVYSNMPAGVDDWLIVRFDGYVTNVGDGPLDIAGNPQIPGGVVQRARTGADWTTVGSPPDVRYETADGHNHFHLKRAMEYALYGSGPDPAARARVAPASKVGFCLFDTEPVLADQDEPVYDFTVSHFCEADNPGATSLRMGVSRGWRDIYSRSLQFQYVNVSNVPPGRYLLGATADPDNQIVETDEVNPTAFAEAATTIPGVLAAPVRATLDRDAQVPVTLGVTAVGTGAGIALRNRRFRVVQAPAHGHLDRAGGRDLRGHGGGGGDGSLHARPRLPRDRLVQVRGPQHLRQRGALPDQPSQRGGPAGGDRRRRVHLGRAGRARRPGPRPGCRPPW